MSSLIHGVEIKDQKYILEEQSYQGLHCLLFRLHFWNHYIVVKWYFQF